MSSSIVGIVTGFERENRFLSLSARHRDGAKTGNERPFTADADIGGVRLISIDMHLGYGVGTDADQRLTKYQSTLFVANMNVHEHAICEAQASGIIRVGMDVPCGHNQSIAIEAAGRSDEPNRWRALQFAAVANRRVDAEREAIRSRDFDLGSGPLGAEDGDPLQATFGSLKRDALACCPLARLAQRNGGRQLVPGSEQGLDR
jgi:hypothetical protein